MAVTKADLVERINQKVGGFSKRESAEIVDAVFELIRDALAKGESAKLSGFGKFAVRQKRTRTGRNPQTGQPLEISARKVMTFKPSQVLKKILNSQ